MEIKKVCTKCDIEKELDSFGKRKDGIHGRRADCKECRKSIKSEYYQNNKKKLIKDNIEGRKRRKLGIYIEFPSEEERMYKRQEYLRDYTKNRYKNDLRFRISSSIRGMLHRCFKGSDNYYMKLGFTFEQLKDRIEYNFKDGMNWDNYGEWVIDHKKPLSLFLKQGINDPKLINMLSNLQPLWKQENGSKGCKFKILKT